MWLYFQEVTCKCNKVYRLAIYDVQLPLWQKCNGLELLHWWRLRQKSYFCLLTWPKTIDKCNQWGIFSLNDCHSHEAINVKPSCDRSTRYIFRYFFEQCLLFQTCSFYCQKVFHSLLKMKIKRNSWLVNTRWP